MKQAFVVTGSLAEGRVVTLDEPLPVTSGKVRVVLECVDAAPAMDPAAFEKMLRERQQARGHVPRTKEEIDAYLREERDCCEPNPTAAESTPEQPAADLRTFLTQLWERQRQRGHRPPTKEEVDAYLAAERSSWNR